MKILVVGANGKTGRHVIEALRNLADPITIRGFSRRPVINAAIDEAMQGDLDNPDDRARAVEGVNAIVHYGPPFDPRETSMGTGMIDAAIAARVSRFIYISVIHPGISDLMNHQAKQTVEAYLLNTDLDWTILRPQHYMQNIDIGAAVRAGRLAFPWPVETRLGHVDMCDLAKVAAKVVMETGHSYASYDIAADEHLRVDEICATISRLSKRRVSPCAEAPDQVIDRISQQHSLPIYTVEAMHRLFGYYARRGIRGNGKVLGWLLGHPPTSFESYVSRRLAEG
jgi:uncharacterized protein YbjT (DUF2867 family)